MKEHVSMERETTRFIALQALEWRLRMDQPSSNTKQQCLKWLKQSPDHVRELLLISALEGQLQRTRPQLRMDQLRKSMQDDIATNTVALANEARAHDERLNRSRMRRQVFPWAALLAIALLALPEVLEFEHPVQPSTAADFVATRTLLLPLDDGSSITLAPEARLSVVVDSDSRAVMLKKGAATFNIVSDAARPFSVRTGQVTVRANHGKFDLRRHEQLTTVKVIEGAIAVADPRAAPPITLKAGQDLTIADSTLTQDESRDDDGRHLTLRIATTADNRS